MFPEGLHFKRTRAKINSTRVGQGGWSLTWQHEINRVRSREEHIVRLLAGALALFISVSIFSPHAEMRVLFLACLSPKTGNCTTAERIRYSNIAVWLAKPGSIAVLHWSSALTTAYPSTINPVRRSFFKWFYILNQPVVHYISLCHVFPCIIRIQHHCEAIFRWRCCTNKYHVFCTCSLLYNGNIMVFFEIGYHENAKVYIRNCWYQEWNFH